jgi:AMIN domain
MVRLPYFGALISVALLAGPLAAQSHAPSPRATQGQAAAEHGSSEHASSATVEHVVVHETGDAMEVEIQTSGGMASPDTQAITGPDRIVVDFPGALPSAELRALKVNRGALKGVRSGLFFNNPPITRIVLDLTEPQSYRISTSQNSVVVRLGAANAASAAVENEPRVGAARLRQAALISNAGGVSGAGNRGSATSRISSETSPARVVNASAMAAIPVVGVATPKAASANLANASPVAAMPQTTAPAVPVVAPVPVEPQKPAVDVSYENGLLSIRAEKATLSQVLYEVHLKTQADIAIPAGAEQEEVAANLGPAPARDVLAALLNGSVYNFIFVGDELALERVILTRRDATNF